MAVGPQRKCGGGAINLSSLYGGFCVRTDRGEVRWMISSPCESPSTPFHLLALHHQSHLTYIDFTDMSQTYRPVGTKGLKVRVKTNAFAVEMDLTRVRSDTPKEYCTFPTYCSISNSPEFAGLAPHICPPVRRARGTGDTVQCLNHKNITTGHWMKIFHSYLSAQGFW